MNIKERNVRRRLTSNKLIKNVIKAWYKFSSLSYAIPAIH